MKQIHTSETRYGTLQYNVNSVITWLQSWLPIFPSHPATVWTDSWPWCVEIKDL